MKLVVDYVAAEAETRRLISEGAIFSVESVCEVAARCLRIVTDETPDDAFKVPK